MDRHLLRIFQHELETQCKFVVAGAHTVNKNLERDVTDGVWWGLQGILISASNASKLLWGGGRTDEEVKALWEARRPLRESVEVDDSSPLNTRKVRNSFEHFDERLDAWFGESENHVYVGRNIGPPDMIVVGGQAPSDQFGHFDPATTILTFWEQSIELNPVLAEAEVLLARLAAIKDSRTGPEASDP